MSQGTVEVTILSGVNFKNTQVFGRQDPYYIVHIGKTKYKSKVFTDGGTNPSFNETSKFGIEKLDDSMFVEVWNANNINSDILIGNGQLALKKLATAKNIQEEIPLVDKKGKSTGSLRVLLNFKPSSSSPQMPKTQQHYGQSAPPQHSYQSSNPHVPPQTSYNQAPPAYPSQPHNPYLPQTPASTTSTHPGVVQGGPERYAQPANGSYPGYPSAAGAYPGGPTAPGPQGYPGDSGGAPSYYPGMSGGAPGGYPGGPAGAPGGYPGSAGGYPGYPGGPAHQSQPSAHPALIHSTSIYNVPDPTTATAHHPPSAHVAQHNQYSAPHGYPHKSPTPAGYPGASAPPAGAHSSVPAQVAYQQYLEPNAKVGSMGGFGGGGGGSSHAAAGYPQKAMQFVQQQGFGKPGKTGGGGKPGKGLKKYLMPAAVGLGGLYLGSKLIPKFGGFGDFGGDFDCDFD